MRVSHHAPGRSGARGAGACGQARARKSFSRREESASAAALPVFSRMRHSRSPPAMHEAIIEVWDPDNLVLLRHAATPKRRASHSHYPFKQAVWDRVALIETAIQHHLAGAYESSIPMILAQIDGMSRELTGSSFMFTTNHEEPH